MSDQPHMSGRRLILLGVLLLLALTAVVLTLVRR